MHRLLDWLAELGKEKKSDTVFNHSDDILGGMVFKFLSRSFQALLIFLVYSGEEIF